MALLCSNRYSMANGQMRIVDRSDATRFVSMFDIGISIAQTYHFHAHPDPWGAQFTPMFGFRNSEEGGGNSDQITYKLWAMPPKFLTYNPTAVSGGAAHQSDDASDIPATPAPHHPQPDRNASPKSAEAQRKRRRTVDLA